MGYLRKVEDVFKPATPEDVKGRQMEIQKTKGAYRYWIDVPGWVSFKITMSPEVNSAKDALSLAQDYVSDFRLGAIGGDKVHLEFEWDKASVLRPHMGEIGDMYTVDDPEAMKKYAFQIDPLQEDIFKGAGSEEVKARQEELARQKLATMQTAVCPHCKEKLLDVGVTENWNGYATIDQDWKWDGGRWVEDDESRKDYGEGDTEFVCKECGGKIDFDSLNIPGPWD